MGENVKFIFAVLAAFAFGCLVYVVIMLQREPEHLGPPVRTFEEECARRVYIPCTESEREYYDRTSQ